MFKLLMNKKGIAMLVVLGILLVVFILANVIIHLMLGQARLTRHQVGRIQAYYADLAGINYAMEQLRTGTWTPSSCPSGCDLTFDAGGFNPPSIVDNKVSITLIPAGTGNCYIPPASTGGACIKVTATYTTPK